MLFFDILLNKEKNIDQHLLKGISALIQFYALKQTKRK